MGGKSSPRLVVTLSDWLLSFSLAPVGPRLSASIAGVRDFGCRLWEQSRGMVCEVSSWPQAPSGLVSGHPVPRMGLLLPGIQSLPSKCLA